MPIFNAPVDFQKAPSTNFVSELLPIAPANPTVGQRYFDTTLAREGYYSGLGWIYLDNIVQTPTYQRVSDSSGSTYIYFGKSVPGSLQTDSVWQVGRVTQGSNPEKTYAAIGAFTVKWSDRLTLTYS